MLSLKNYRRAAVPVLAIQTPDPADVLRIALKEANGNPLLQWDCMRGIIPADPDCSLSKSIADQLNQNQDSSIATGNPIEFLRAIELLKNGMISIKESPIVVALGLAEILSESDQTGIQARQAVWNLRDVFSTIRTILVFTVPIGWTNPFPNDIAVAVMELPTADDHIKICDKICDSAKLPEDKRPTADELVKIGDSLLGVSGFASEQSLALSVSKNGIDLESLRTRKRQQIAETAGLSVYTGKETFQDIGGCDQAKKLFRAYLNGLAKPGAIIFIDEIEKFFSNGDSGDSGVSKALLAYILTYMQDIGATGIIFVGPPGAAKSAIGKAVGNEGGIPTIPLDMGAIKAGIVGESEGRMRNAFSVISSISGNKPFFVATCNKVKNIPPELKRRFTLGTMFFDLPDTTERETIWKIYTEKYNLPEQSLPDSDGWTGAEIRQCCDLAYRLGLSLIESSEYVVPVSVSAREVINTLRTEASGRYLSASQPGVYTYGKTGAMKTRNVSL